MSEKKTLTMTFRLKPATKDGLHLIADRESRSIANSIEWLVKDYFETRELPWPPIAETRTISGASSDNQNRSKGKNKK